MTCALQQLTIIVEMGYTIVRLLQHYDKIIDYGNKSDMRCEIVITPAHGTNVGFVKELAKASG
jgi:hypothetical protein